MQTCVNVYTNMTTPQGLERIPLVSNIGQSSKIKWLTPNTLTVAVPFAVLTLSFAVICGIIVLGTQKNSVLPKSYVNVPWSKGSSSGVLDVQIDSFWDWFALNVLLFFMTFLYGIINRATSFWTWEQSNFRIKSVDGVRLKNSMPFSLELPVMAFGGEIIVTVFGYVGLLFSFVHVSYLINAIVARGCVIVVLNWLKRRGGTSL
jgi:hypothetical protein